MLIIAGKTYVTQAEQRDAYVASFEEFVRRARNVPGCLDFVIAADPIEANRVNIFELWQSKEQLDEYRARAEPSAMTVEILDENVKKYDISSSGPPFP